MANINGKITDKVSYSYDMEAKNSLGLRTKVLAWEGKLVYDKDKIDTIPVEEETNDGNGNG